MQQICHDPAGRVELEGNHFQPNTHSKEPRFVVQQMTRLSTKAYDLRQADLENFLQVTFGYRISVELSDDAYYFECPRELTEVSIKIIHIGT